MKEILKNKNCLITGATGGIGKEIELFNSEKEAIESFK